MHGEHYKDGTWRYPEFAQPEDIFLEIIEQIDSPFFGVQYDPSRMRFVGGFDPSSSCKGADRVVTMHASDRYLAPGATLDDLKIRRSLGYATALRHGETGKGLNDYDAIFKLLAEVRFDGWISVEAGMEGLDEMRVGHLPEGKARPRHFRPDVRRRVHGDRDHVVLRELVDYLLHQRRPGALPRPLLDVVRCGTM